MILFCSTIIATAPTPAMLRPMPMPAGSAAIALITGPTTMVTRPPPRISRSPNRRPSRPSGSARKAPSSMNAPISVPSVA
ncbi:MAG: hypothetical protein WDN25_22240 [Acetobacteraceae bacterium]